MEAGSFVPEKMEGALDVYSPTSHLDSGDVSPPFEFHPPASPHDQPLSGKIPTRIPGIEGYGQPPDPDP